MQNSKLMKSRIFVELESEISDSFRCKMAANSLDINVKEKSKHVLEINNIHIPDNWNVGLIYGASGSGKTTLAKEMFGKNVFSFEIDQEKSILDQMPVALEYKECASMLNGIGLSSVPCWIRPIKTLSNGQKARAEAVLLMCSSNDIIVIDEWTSVVDRVVAKAMSNCIQKFAKKQNKKIILLSCHYDILEWLTPDWLIDCNKQKFLLPESKDFFFTKRESLQFDIKEIDSSSWRYFSKYHYLSKRLPGGKNYFYGLFYKNEQIGFQCFSNYTPHRVGTIKIMHSNRTVIHPDYVGLGLGIQLINKCSKLFHEKYNFRIMAKFSSIPVYKSMIKDPNWSFLGQKFMMTSMPKGGTMLREKGFRELGVKTYSFEFKYNKK
jgi:energy-coupling factor transporter ATP-binding protein EcfA2